MYFIVSISSIWSFLRYFLRSVLLNFLRSVLLNVLRSAFLYILRSVFLDYNFSDINFLHSFLLDSAFLASILSEFNIRAYGHLFGVSSCGNVYMPIPIWQNLY